MAVLLSLITHSPPRSLPQVGKYHCSTQQESQSLAEAGLKYAERSVTADDTNFSCHKWMGIVLSWSSDFEGYKKKIERSFDIRDCFLVSFMWSFGGVEFLQHMCCCVVHFVCRKL